MKRKELSTSAVSTRPLPRLFPASLGFMLSSYSGAKIPINGIDAWGLLLKVKLRITALILYPLMLTVIVFGTFITKATSRMTWLVVRPGAVVDPEDAFGSP